MKITILTAPMRSKLWLLICAALVTVGCARPDFSNAEYDNGIVFSAMHGVVHTVSWYRPEKPPAACPIVVHLKGLDIDDVRLSSPKVMRNLGGHDQNRHGNTVDVTVTRSDVNILCEYEKDKLVWVDVLVDYRDESFHSLTVNGKKLTLPLSEDKLFAVLGPPRRFVRNDVLVPDASMIRANKR
jgi:hypothetical protein